MCVCVCRRESVCEAKPFFPCFIHCVSYLPSTGLIVYGCLIKVINCAFFRRIHDDVLTQTFHRRCNGWTKIVRFDKVDNWHACRVAFVHTWNWFYMLANGTSWRQWRSLHLSFDSMEYPNRTQPYRLYSRSHAHTKHQRTKSRTESSTEVKKERRRKKTVKISEHYHLFIDHKHMNI